MQFASSNQLIFPFSWISMLILCSMAIFLPTINCWNEEKCGGIFLNEMDSFEFEKINIGEKVPKNNQKVHFLKANGDKDHGLVSSVFMGYMYQNDKTYTPKNCIAVKLTPNDEEHRSAAKNNIETINAIQQYEHHHEHTKYLINVLYLGTTPENYVTIMEMAEGSHRQIWKIRNFADGIEGKKEIIKEAKKFLLPLVEFHKIGLIHGDVKRANYVFVHSDMNNIVDHDHKVNEHPKVKALENGHPKALLDNGKGHLINTLENGNDTDELENADLKLIDFDTSVRLPSHLQRADSKARANFKMAPFWPDRWGIFHGPEFGKKESEIQVSTKIDIWSTGMVIFDMLLSQPKYRLEEKTIYGRLRQIADIFRHFKWVDTKEKYTHKLRNTANFVKKPMELKFDADLLSEYSDAIHHILEVRQHYPKMFILFNNMLHLDGTQRMTAAGALEYLEGNCKPPNLDSITLEIGGIPVKKFRIFLATNKQLLQLFNNGGKKMEEIFNQIRNLPICEA